MKSQKGFFAQVDVFSALIWALLRSCIQVEKVSSNVKSRTRVSSNSPLFLGWKEIAFLLHIWKRIPCYALKTKTGHMCLLKRSGCKEITGAERDNYESTPEKNPYNFIIKNYLTFQQHLNKNISLIMEFSLKKFWKRINFLKKTEIKKK